VVVLPRVVSFELTQAVGGFLAEAIAQYLGTRLDVLQDSGHPAYFLVETSISHICGIIALVTTLSTAE
jgi:hypothetical protein